MLEVGVTVDRIECVRFSDRVNENSKANYKLNVSLEEKHRRPDGLTIGFNLELTGSPQVVKITVTGVARLAGSQKEIGENTAKRDDRAPPKIVETIYERLYGLLYLLAGSMRVPYPTPNLVKKA